MKKKSLSITVGIPAYNEEKNIRFLLQDVLKQKQIGWTLNGIIVLSDSSNDRTVDTAKELMHKKIRVAEGKRRIGKSRRINQFFKEIKSDIAVVLDGDTRLGSFDCISELVKPMKENEEIMLTSGREIPVRPITQVQKVVSHGAKLWDTVRSNVGQTDMYYCTGRIRAFRKRLYLKIRLPAKSSEDIYPYLYCQLKKYEFSYVTQAKVKYNLPTSLPDYIKQTRRFLKSKQVHSQNFGEDFIRQYFTITLRSKLLALFPAFKKHPILTIEYIMFLTIPKILSFWDTVRNQPVKGVWSIAGSTKRLS